MFVATFTIVNNINGQFTPDVNGNLPMIATVRAGEGYCTIINGTIFKTQGYKPNKAYLCQNIPTTAKDGSLIYNIKIIQTLNLKELISISKKLGNPIDLTKNLNCKQNINLMNKNEIQIGDEHYENGEFLLAVKYYKRYLDKLDDSYYNKEIDEIQEKISYATMYANSAPETNHEILEQFNDDNLTKIITDKFKEKLRNSENPFEGLGDEMKGFGYIKLLGEISEELKKSLCEDRDENNIPKNISDYTIKECVLSVHQELMNMLTSK